ncbi:MAG: hypothetical protein ABFD96_13090 [Armatimonadia bacterium]
MTIIHLHDYSSSATRRISLRFTAPIITNRPHNANTPQGHPRRR